MTVSHALSAKGVAKIKKFVEAGGNLFTEDWGLKEILEKAWPKFVVAGTYLREQQVDIAPARGRTSHPLMRGVFIDPDRPPPPKEDEKKKEGESGGDGQKTKEGKRTIDEEELIRRIRTLNHKWQIDDESPYLKIRDRTAVMKLLESEKVGKIAEGNDSVAVTFFAGKKGAGSGPAESGVERRASGRVLHVLSHFGKQSSIEDEYALQNLLLNFLLEANRHYHAGKKGGAKKG